MVSGDWCFQNADREKVIRCGLMENAIYLEYCARHNQKVEDKNKQNQKLYKL